MSYLTHGEQHEPFPESHGAHDRIYAQPRPPAKVKRVQVTSVEAYERVKKTLPLREAFILGGLEDFLDSNGKLPTAYELYQFLQGRLEALGGLHDINSVRPPLTHLKDKALVKFGPKRTCTVTGQKVYTWALADQVLEAMQ